jgi:hypothetical protein
MDIPTQIKASYLFFKKRGRGLTTSMSARCHIAAGYRDTNRYADAEDN